jgi:hypothetical protein
MNQLFQTRRFLDQHTAAMGILKTFGKEHLYKRTGTETGRSISPSLPNFADWPPRRQCGVAAINGGSRDNRITRKTSE